MLRFVRLIGGAVGLILALGIASYDASRSGFFSPTLEGRLILLAWASAWTVLGYAVLPYITVEPARWLARAVRDMSSGEFVAALIGLTLGLLMGLLLGLPLTNLPAPYSWVFPLIVSIVLGLGTMGLTVAKRQDLWNAASRVGLFGPARHGRAPTTVLPDRSRTSTRARSSTAASRTSWHRASSRGRWWCRASCSVSSSTSPTTPTPDRRSRGRRGLEILAALQKDHRIDLELSDEDAPEATTVDEKLVVLASKRGAAILTTDYNLNRVAQLQGIRVMNLNQLANAIKPAFLPGDEVHVKVVQQGKEPGQGVAYLDDGTMIVVEGGGSYLQRELDVTVIRVLQTVAGRMVFAQPRST